MAHIPPSNPLKSLGPLFEKALNEARRRDAIKAAKKDQLAQDVVQAKSDGKGRLVQFPAAGSARGSKKKRSSDR